jgi:hypothetical protein
MSHHQKGDPMKSTLIVIAALIILVGCQVSHNAQVMVNPTTGDRVVVNQHGTTGKLGSALAARWAHESDVEALKAKGYVEEGK